MYIDDSFSNKVLTFLEEQKYALILVVAALAALIFLIIFIHWVHSSTVPTVSGITPQSQTVTNKNANKNTSIVAKVESFLFHTNDSNTTSESTQSAQSTQNSTSALNVPQTNSQAVSQQVQPTGITQESGTSGTGTNNSIGDQPPSQTQGSNPNQTTFQIVFTGPDGTQTYTPPDSPPEPVTWATYVDNTYHYSIQYPANWQIVNGKSNFSKGYTLFLPGENAGDITQEYIAFGWSNYNLFPAIALNDDGSTMSPALVTGVTGTIYTKGPMGISYVVSIFPYQSGYFGLITYSSDPNILYIYQYMMQSLTFNI